MKKQKKRRRIRKTRPLPKAKAKMSAFRSWPRRPLRLDGGLEDLGILDRVLFEIERIRQNLRNVFRRKTQKSERPRSRKLHRPEIARVHQGKRICKGKIYWPLFSWLNFGLFLSVRKDLRSGIRRKHRWNMRERKFRSGLGAGSKLQSAISETGRVTTITNSTRNRWICTKLVTLENRRIFWWPWWRRSTVTIHRRRKINWRFSWVGWPGETKSITSRCAKSKFYTTGTRHLQNLVIEISRPVNSVAVHDRFPMWFPRLCRWTFTALWSSKKSCVSTNRSRWWNLYSKWTLRRWRNYWVIRGKVWYHYVPS